MAAQHDVRLRPGQLLARSDHELRLHEIDAGDEFGHGMFDLDAGVHLDEVELAVFVQELEGAGVAVADRAASLDHALTHAGALRRRDARRRGFFDHLLMAPLHGAVTLAQVDDVAVVVGEHLELDMPRFF